MFNCSLDSFDTAESNRLGLLENTIVCVAKFSYSKTFTFILQENIQAWLELDVHFLCTSYFHTLHLNTGLTPDWLKASVIEHKPTSTHLRGVESCSEHYMWKDRIFKQKNKKKRQAQNNNTSQHKPF